MKPKHYSLRSAYIKWLELHNETHRIQTGRNGVRIPKWFSEYIRNDCSCPLISYKEETNNYCNRREMTLKQRRDYIHYGYYSVYLTDEQLLNLNRPEWIK